jgi:biotin transport system substrate-specific component
MFRDVAAMLLGGAVLYVCGVPWLAMVTGLPIAKAFAVGVVPFLLGDGIKIAAAAFIAKSVRPAMRLT